MFWLWTNPNNTTRFTKGSHPPIVLSQLIQLIRRVEIVLQKNSIRSWNRTKLNRYMGRPRDCCYPTSFFLYKILEFVLVIKYIEFCRNIIISL